MYLNKKYYKWKKIQMYLLKIKKYWIYNNNNIYLNE